MYLKKCRKRCPRNSGIGEVEKRVLRQQGLCKGYTLHLKLPTSPFPGLNLKVTFSDRSPLLPRLKSVPHLLSLSH